MSREEFNAFVSKLERRLVGASFITGGPGVEVRQIPSGTAISLSGPVLSRLEPSEDSEDDSVLKAGFWARITGVQECFGGTPPCNQWEYGFVRVKKGQMAYEPGAWTTMPFVGVAYNTIEAMNSPMGVQGNGVNVDGVDFPETFDIQPCPVGNIVWIRLVTNNQGLREYWFSYESGIDGTCK